MTSSVVISFFLPLAYLKKNKIPALKQLFYRRLPSENQWVLIGTDKLVRPHACSNNITALTKFSFVSRVISCCRLASMRASGGSCRFCAKSCCWRLFSSFRLWISPRSDSSSFSWLFFCDCSWDSSSLKKLSSSCKITLGKTHPKFSEGV